MKNLMRKSLAVTAALGLIGTLAACSNDSGNNGGGDEGTSGEPIVLGVVGPQSGPLAEIGENQLAGAQIAAAHINAAGGINGRPVEIANQDEQTTPETAVAAVRNHANAGVNIVLGMLSSANCLALGDQLVSMDTVLIISGCTNDGLTGQDGAEAPFSNMFRVNNNDSALVPPLAEVVAERFPEATDYSAFGYDYITGTTQWAMFQDEIKDNGVKLNVVSETFVPIGEQNFQLQIQQLVNQVTDPKTSALYLGTFSSGTGSFLTQAAPHNISDKFAVIANPGGYYPIARTLNGLAPHVWNSYDYNWAAFDNEQNDAFVADFKAKTGKLPVDWSYDAYVAVYAAKAAIEKADGKTDTASIIEALKGLSFDTPGGELTIDAKTHQANAPVIVTHTVGDTTAEENVRVIETFIVRR